MEYVVFGLIRQIIITQTMFVAGNDLVEILDMIVLWCLTKLLAIYLKLTIVYEVVGYGHSRLTAE